MKTPSTIIISRVERRAAPALMSLSSPSLVPWGGDIGVGTRKALRTCRVGCVGSRNSFSQVSVDRRARPARRRSALVHSWRTVLP